MRVLLVHPPQRGKAENGIRVPPLGLAYLAAAAQREGHEVGLLDARLERLSPEAIRSRAQDFAPDLIGLGGLSPVFGDTIVAARAVAPLAQHLVIGGPHATIRGERVFEELPEATVVLRGEGELTFPELLGALEENRDALAIPGVVTRDGTGSAPVPITELDALAHPARELLSRSGYEYPLWGARRIATAMTSRGCPFRCIFCEKAVHGDPYRERSARSVGDELEQLLQLETDPFVIFYDDLFTLKRKRVVAICEEILRRDLRFRWKAEARVEQVDRELLQLMKEAGMVMLAFGVESGREEGLKFLKKGFRIEHVRKAFQLCREERVATLAYFILGLPNETREQARDSIRLAIEIRPTYAQFSTLSPFEGTGLYPVAREQGWLKESSAVSPLDAEPERVTAMGPAWDDQALKQLLREAYLRFYLRPSALRNVLARGGAQGFLRGLRAGWRVVQWAFAT